MKILISEFDEIFLINAIELIMNIISAIWKKWTLTIAAFLYIHF